MSPSTVRVPQPRRRTTAMRMLLVSAALVAVGGIDGPSSSHTAEAREATTADVVVVPISGAAQLSVASPAVRLDPPAPQPVVVAVADPPVPVVAPAPVVNRSTCRTNLPNAVMTIVIPDISYNCPVYAGGQSTIDAGAVTLVNDRGTSSLFATTPGGAGTLWIAAHRTSHGGAFAAVPSLVDGAVVTVSNGTVTAKYRIVGRVYVEVASNGRVINAAGVATEAATFDAVFRTDGGGGLAPRLLLQTCDGARFRWMIYADLIP